MGAPHDCQGCYECQTTFAEDPSGHKELQPHDWGIMYNQNTGKPYFVCEKCNEIDEVTSQAAAKVTTPEEDNERYQANMKYLYEQELRDSERFIEYMKKKKDLAIEIPPDDGIDEIDETTPKNLDEALEILWNEKNIQFAKEAKSDNFTGALHHGFGTGLRNGWNLWGKSPLTEWFNSVGIYHADDMSGIIMDSFWRKANGKDIDLEGQIKVYRAHWDEYCPDINKGII
jgi:hypothetical protein